MSPRWTHVLAVLALLTAAASLPALAGGPVYDDRLLDGHPLMDGLDDALAVFGRSSDDYIGLRSGSGPAIAGVATYRPLPMLALILPHALGAPFFVHHLLSLALHLAVVALAARLLARDGRLSWPSVGLLAAFALHPALGEAWLWVNGLSDVMAGLALLGLAAMLPRGGVAPPLIAAAGLLSKVTFLPAAAAVVWVSGERRRGAIALVVGAAIYFAGHAVAVGAAGTPEGHVGAALARAPALVALGAEALLVPWARPMRLLAWELADPWTAARLVALAVVVGSAGWLVVRRRWRALVLLGGAVATLLPAVVVADGFWLGLDRYLYLPACLLLLALAPSVARPGRPAWAAFAALAVPCALTAMTFRSHGEWALSIAEARPTEPTGYLLAAAEAGAQGRPAAARALLEHLPPPPYPPPVAHRAAQDLIAAGLAKEAAAQVEAASARDPSHPDLRFDLLALRGSQGRWSEALAIARGLWPDARRRPAVRAVLEGWMDGHRVPPDQADAVQALLGDR